MQIYLSEEAFAQPTSFDLLVLPYYRFTSPLPQAAKLPEPFDLDKLHGDAEDKNVISFTVNSTASMYANKQEIRDLMDKIEDDSYWKKVFDTLLRAGNQYEKQISQFVDENKYLSGIEDLYEVMTKKKREVRDFLFSKQQYTGSSDEKKLLSQLQKIVKEETYSGYQIGFGELKLYYELAEHLFDRLSTRPIKDCHP